MKGSMQSWEKTTKEKKLNKNFKVKKKMEKKLRRKN